MMPDGFRDGCQSYGGNCSPDIGLMMEAAESSEGLYGARETEWCLN
jgi:hypothetical protein